MTYGTLERRTELSLSLSLWMLLAHFTAINDRNEKAKPINRMSRRPSKSFTGQGEAEEREERNK